MDNPYGAKLPPSLVTVENGFAFNNEMDDSDLSSLNTTPRKQDQARKALTRGRLSPSQIEQADLGLKLSKANRSAISKRADATLGRSHSWNQRQDETGTPPPIHEVQVAGERGRSRDEKLRDRKEKYRRMASPSSRRVRPTGGPLNSWRKKADQRLAEKERGKPWLEPAVDDDKPDDEEDNDEEQKDQEEEEDDDDDVSPMRAKRHTFEEEEEEDSASTNEPEAQLKVSQTVSTDSEERRKERSIVTIKRKLVMERSESPNVDMYGCPIFRVDSDDEDLAETKATLDKLDSETAENTTDSIKAMLSSASFFSKSAAQKLAEAGAGGAKLLGDAAQAAEELVLGPVEEGHESDAEESKDSDDTPPPPPPPPPPLSRQRRGRSPTAAVDATNSAERRSQDNSLVESSFVLDDNSEVDVHYVLDDLSTMEQKKTKASAEKKAFEPIKDEAKEDVKNNGETENSNQNAVDKSFESDVVEIDKVSSIDDEVEATIEIMDAIHVKDEIQRLETLHAQKAKAAIVPSKSTEAETKTEIADAALDSETFETCEEDHATQRDTESIDAAAASETSGPYSYETTTKEADSVVKNDDDPTADDTLEIEKAAAAALSVTDDASDPSERTSPIATLDRDESNQVFDSSVVSKEEASAASENVAVDSAIVVSVVGAAAVIAVTPDKEDIERDKGQIIIATSDPSILEESEVEPEFPPTDDADVDMINFDTVSVDTESTRLQINLDDSKHELKKNGEPRKEEMLREKEVSAPPETAPAAETPKEKKKKKVGKEHHSIGKEVAKVSASKDTSNSGKEGIPSKPAMVKNLDDNNGIAKGDVVLSLLNANLSEANRAPKGRDQVRDAIIRMRDMRRRQEKVELPEYDPNESGATAVESLSKRSALPVDVDDMHVVGAFEHVKTLEDDAIEHLKHDEFEAALELYEEIITIYTEAFKETAKKRKKKDKNDHKAYIGAALHNIGILQLLRFDFEEALSYFEKAAETRKAHFGEGSVDHLASLGKIALCHYAMDEYETAHKSLEQVLELSKNHLAGLTDFMQVAEVLNNLGCLSFMCGQADSAMTMFKECLEIQSAVLKQSLYGGPRFAGQSTSLGISITRGNIGYVQMLTKNAGPAIIEFEASLMHQQMILSDAHDCAICTMDHLAVANLLAKNKEEAMKMLGRMLRAQLAACGATDERCVLTLSKLQLVQTEKTDYLEKALDQLWDQHSSSASPSTKAARTAAAKRSNKMLKKLSFRKKAAKLNH